MPLRALITLALGLAALSPAALAKAPDKVLVVAPQGSDANAVVAALKTLGVDATAYLARGAMLMESALHPDHKKPLDEAIAAARYKHLLILDTPNALSYPEFYFEGAYQLQQRAKKRRIKPVLLMLGGAKGLELAYRVGRGCSMPIAPVSQLVEAASAKGLSADRARCAAAAAIAAMAAGKAKTEDPLITLANETFKREEKVKHYEGSFAEQGQIHVMKLPRDVRTVRVMMTGTSTERGWHKSARSAFSGARIKEKWTVIKNDDEGRSFGQSDMPKVRQHFAESPREYLLMFARGYTVNAKQIRGDNQPYLQCQIYDKQMPGQAGAESLAIAARTVMQRSSGYYHNAKSMGLSLIPLHIAIARAHHQEPDTILLRDKEHMSKPFLDMLAVMSVISRTGIKPRRLSAHEQIGAEVITQLAHLSASGKHVKDKGR